MEGVGRRRRQTAGRAHKITAEVAALRRERDGPGADLDAVRDVGIARVQEAVEAATAEVRRAAAEFERLTAAPAARRR